MLDGTNKTLFINKFDKGFIVTQIYVDDIIFGGFHEEIVNNFIQNMQSEFEMSIVGELTFSFFGLLIKKEKNEIFISQKKYVKVLSRNLVLINLS